MNIRLPDQGIVERAVRGICRDSGSIDEHLLYQVQCSYRRAAFFTMGFSPLAGYAAEFHLLLRTSGLLPDSAIPGRAIITKAYKGVEPSSLEALMRLRKAVAVFRDEGRKLPASAEFAEKLATWFPHPDVLGPKSIIPSLHLPAPSKIKLLRESLDPKRTARDLGAQILAKTAVHEGAKATFIGKLEEGYTSPHGKGWYRLTEPTARLIFDTFKAELPNHDLLYSFELFAPIDAEEGPRSGQVTKGLRWLDGNLMP